MPPHQVPYTVKLKTCLKMCIHRLRYAQEKQISVAKQNRRQVAQLLSEGQEQRARYRAETLILADIHAELFEILLVYCELLTARVHILATLAAENEPAHLPLGSNTPPATPSPNPESNFGMESSNDKPSSERDAVRSMVYAAPYIPEVRELNQLSDLLSHSCKGFLNSPLTAPEKITKKCNPPLPSEELVNLYLTEIAKTYDVTCSLYDASSTSNYDEGDEIDQDDTDSGDETSGCQDEKDDEKKIPMLQSLRIIKITLPQMMKL
ncbi:hypothetical protein TBLA_0A05490 [Henningerozyma blattae CBS 6284]|uniref:Regulator of Vps4 activity in the MVB pathway protein n=1 Tax=Henningerozyma blattae (strain ATCC 34711 / CBS 6284 / DSM 70876 / NBRC 10599 / NRRL Y-10934 / UCD 77-7) TaxID=1071380 RepID=I2GW40_HENB6|nr:hypothetical protein TBLA_0A05490 [Tetrapisispora blattae CBS 6284]CCH58342.1 hypothetical protein TBLA_0A05490 [Tetrapisispora blattae CBS 6284]